LYKGKFYGPGLVTIDSEVAKALAAREQFVLDKEDAAPKAPEHITPESQAVAPPPPPAGIVNEPEEAQLDDEDEEEETTPSFTAEELDSMSKRELITIAASRNITHADRLAKAALVAAILKHQAGGPGDEDEEDEDA